MKFFTTPNSKKIIATLRIVTVDKSELTHEIRKWISKNVLAKFVKHILKNQLYLISLKHLLALPLYFNLKLKSLLESCEMKSCQIS